MQLQKLTEKNIIHLLSKRICCYERTVSYLLELCEKYRIENNIDFIIDDNERNQGIYQLKGRNIPVYSSKILTQVDFSNSVIVITSDYYKEAFEKLCYELKNIINKEIIYYFLNYETEIEEFYRNQYKGANLENIIVFRSGPHADAYVKGMDFADNARALFEYMLANKYNDIYELVWMVKKPEEFEKYQGIPNVIFISFDWSVSKKKKEQKQYYRALCLAKFLFFTDAYGFVRNCRFDQVRIQLWHGCGFKTRVNFVSCEKRYDYTTVISDLYGKIHKKIYGLNQSQILVTGYAKQDWLFHPLEEEFKKLNIPKAKKILFWVPTFRIVPDKLKQLNEYGLEGDTGLPIVNTINKMKKLNQLLFDKNMALIIKLHPFQDKNSIFCKKYSNIVLLDNDILLEKDIQINQILPYADAMISDYSSIAVDYMLLDRPIGFMLEDMKEYSDSRGFVFDNILEWLPGKQLFCYKDLSNFICEIASGIDSTMGKRRALKAKMHKYGDDNNCRRIVEILNIK